MTHIDDWITNPIHRSEGEKYAKFVLTYFRYPAWAKGDFRQWMGQFKLFCTYQGKRYRVTGARRWVMFGWQKTPIVRRGTIFELT